MERMKKLDLSNSVVEIGRTKCEVWTRVMGYHRPISHFNIGKKSEHFSRVHFNERVSENSTFIKEFSEVK